MHMKFSPPNEFPNLVEELIKKGPANCTNNLVRLLNFLKSRQMKSEREPKMNVFLNKIEACAVKVST